MPPPNEDEPAARAALLTAMTTEHFALTSTVSVATSEASSRASLFVLSTSTTLVALGIAGIDSPRFMPMATIAFLVLGALGVFTELRLVGTTVQSLRAGARMAQIHAFYATLHPEAAAFFAPYGDVPAIVRVPRDLAVGTDWKASLSTMATMIAALNSAVIGVGIGCLLAALDAPDAAAIAVGVVVGAVHGVVFLVRQQRTLSTAPWLVDAPA